MRLIYPIVVWESAGFLLSQSLLTRGGFLLALKVGMAEASN